MASTYSDLKFELIGTGDQSGTWGTTTNNNIGDAIEQAIVGLGNPIFTTDANLTLTLTDTVALQTARALVLNATSSGSLTATRELVVPTIEKQYIVQNNTTGAQSITVKTSGGTGITVPNGRKAHLYVDGTNVVQMFDFVGINGGTIDNAVIGGTTAAAGTFTTATATTGNITTVNATTVDTTNVEVTNIKAKDGTASISLADTTGIATFSKATVVSTTDNTNAALRITQLGTGNALLVEDSANPDSTPVAIDASGNVLVGITTAQTINTLTPAFQQLGAGNYGSIWSGRYSANATGNGIYLSKSRGATVGTNTILQSGDDLGTLFFFGADGTDLIQAASILAEVDGTPGTNDMPGRLVFSTTADGAATPTERVRIDSSGNVGIGTSSPYKRLNATKASSTAYSASDFDIDSLALQLANTTNDKSTGIYFAIGSNGEAAISAVETSDGETALTFGTRGSGSRPERARIDSSGNLLVGTTSAGSARLAVVSGSATVSPIVTQSVAGDAPYQAILVSKFDNNTTTSQNFIQFQVNNGNANCGKITANGANTAAFGSTSDQRVKENIVDLPSQLANILALRPVEYDYIESYGGGHQVGFIAQEMQQVYPDVISEEDTEEKIMSITGWSKTEARLVKAIQEQQALITALTTRITALEAP